MKKNSLMGKSNLKLKMTYLKFILLGLFFLNGLGNMFVGATILDSIGVEKKDGKIFVLHVVDVKETLFSISKRYNIKIEEIKVANPTMGEGLQVGQNLRIPYRGIVQTLPGTTPSNDSKKYKTHTVEKKETLYAIAKKYGVAVEEISKANPGIESGIKEGQQLNIPVVSNPTVVVTPVIEVPAVKTGKIHKVEAKETLFGIAKKYNVSVDEIKKANPELIDGLKEGMEISIPVKGNKNTTVNTNPVVKPVVVKEKEEDKPEVVIPAQNQPKGEFKKITENGMAELLESKVEAPKFQAMHKTASVGTIIQVSNETTGQKIFVRVIGKLTDPSDNKVIIKISQKALDRLGVKEKKVPVTLVYIP